MTPLRFYAVNIPAILLWAPAHVLPGVLAISALHRYAGIPHHTGVGKHYWMLSVLGGALIVALTSGRSVAERAEALSSRQRPPLARILRA